jgi:hypothetical protein
MAAVPIVGTVVATRLVSSWSPLVLVVVLIVTAVQVLTLRRAGGDALPLVALVVVFVNVVGVCGFLYFPSIAAQAQVSANFDGLEKVYPVAARVFAITSLSIWTGGLIGSIHRIQSRTVRRQNGETSPSVFGNVMTRLNNMSAGLVLSFSSIPAVLFLLSDPTGIWSRPSYLSASGPVILTKLAPSVVPLALALAGLVLFRPADSYGRLRAGAIVALYFVLTFSRGSRLLGLFPLILLVCLLGQRRLRGGLAFRPWGALGAVVATIYCLSIPLALRSSSGGAGLMPFIKHAASEPSTVLVPKVGAIFGNVLFSVPLTGGVASTGQNYGFHALTVSINPLPGGLIGWPALAIKLRVNAYTPYNALGELQIQGVATLMLYFLIVGVIISRLQQIATRLPAIRRLTFQVASGGLILLYSISLLQYNLRSATREIWYLLFVMILLRSWPSKASTTRPRSAPRVGPARLSGSSYFRWGLDSPPPMSSMRRR